MLIQDTLSTTGPRVPSLRAVQSLNGLWDFAFLGQIDFDSFRPGTAIPMEKMPVPAAFDALPAYAGQRGVAVYRTRFSVPVGRLARIEWGAVSMRCRIFVDGDVLAEHACGYSPFSVEVPAAGREERELIVLTDNRFDFDHTPMHEEYFDFYQYGGILRDVALYILNASFIETVHVSPTEDFAHGGVETAITLRGAASATATLTLQFDNAEPLIFRDVPLSDGTARLSLNVPNPRIWSPGAPHLHHLKVTLHDSDGHAVDDQSARFGLRRIEARAGSLWLNGKKLQLRGYNRHEWHPNYGPSVPVTQMVADLQLLKDMGCNFIRGSHYPQDQRFLDLCDEFGFLVWEENLGWGQKEKTFQSKKWKADHAQSLREMVSASFNHPSVIIWGFLNEAATKEDYVRPVFEETVANLRAMDPSRPVSYATMYALTDKHYDLADIISINIYPGWYDCEEVDRPLDLIAPKMRECFDAMNREDLRDKPVIVSEIGAEGLYGWRDPHHDFFTEEYQAEYLKRACEAALSHPRCSGIALWQFTDVRTYGGGRSMKRPRAFNNKGTLDEYRRPKAAYQAVRAVFRQAAQAECGSRSLEACSDDAPLQSARGEGSGFGQAQTISQRRSAGGALEHTA